MTVFQAEEPARHFFLCSAGRIADIEALSLQNAQLHVLDRARLAAIAEGRETL